MDCAGVDALIVLQGDVHAFQHTNAVALLSGFRFRGVSFVILRRDGDSTLVVSPPSDLDHAMLLSRTARTRSAEDIREALVACIENLSATSSRLGVVGLDTLDYADALWLEKALDGTARRFDSEFNAVTGRKTNEEIENAEQATQIAEQGYKLLLDLAKPGMSELDLATEICCGMAMAGADDNFLMLSADRHNRAVRPPSSRTLGPGDIILCEISPSFNGQFSQICRTAMVGPGADIYTAKYELLRQSFRNGMEAARPGASVCDIVTAINANLIAEGYGEFCVPPHMRARGHGLGFGSIAPGDLKAESRSIVERDMVFVIHPNQYMPETGYMMCGDPIVITAEGSRNLAARSASFDHTVF
jgi:Xaa-Pro aminopeptidase